MRLRESTFCTNYRTSPRTKHYSFPRESKFLPALYIFLPDVPQNYFQGLEINFKATKIYFQASEIYFRATEKVLYRGVKKLLPRGEEFVHEG